jgi:hypothetical protein
VIDADADDAVVGSEIVDPVGDGFADGVTREVADVDKFSRRSPIARNRSI